jgi:lipoprotein-anchoring transpeptidase ErfK/SrfK
MNPIKRPSRRLFIAILSSAALSLVGCAAGPAEPRYGSPTYKIVSFATREQPGTIVVDPTNHFLYLVQSGGQSLQYEVGVGKEGYGWSGVATVRNKQEWPDWYPTRETLERKPEIRQAIDRLPNGTGIPGGPDNPLGARALYLWQGNTDTLYRIHGTNEPNTIGHDVSAGCIRMRNEDVIDLYNRTPVGTKVVVLAAHSA